MARTTFTTASFDLAFSNADPVSWVTEMGECVLLWVAHWGV